jgi:probable rRNA maturation factor
VSIPSQDGKTTTVEVTVDAPYTEEFDEKIIEATAVAAMNRERVRGPSHVSISVTGDEEIRSLNRDFRNTDRTTDVLSFGNNDADNGVVSADEFPTPPGEEAPLGDIVISYPQADRQATIAGRPVEHELALLTAHGVLHLLGFDHATESDQGCMFNKTDEILEEVLGPDAVPMVPVLGDLPGHALSAEPDAGNKDV